MGTIINFIIFLAVGAIAGWIAGIIMKSEGTTLRNILLGIAGGIIAGALGLSSSNIIGGIIASVIGACLLIFIVRLITKKK